MILRQENPADQKTVFQLIENAFADVQKSDHQEQFLVERLRESKDFIPELSIVAELDNKIVGYILLSKIRIKDGETEHASLSLAPVAVLRGFQNKGIGSALINFAHKKAEELGFKSIILLGHEDYYPKFGYQKASKFGIKLPFDAPDENCMAIELQKNALKNVSGIVVYPVEFFG